MDPQKALVVSLLPSTVIKRGKLENCLSVCLSVCLSICLSICLSVCLSIIYIYIYTYDIIYIHIYIYILYIINHNNMRIYTYVHICILSSPKQYHTYMGSHMKRFTLVHEMSITIRHL